MAFVDVSDLLTDPDFADTITVTRCSLAVGEDGRGTRTQTTLTYVAVVQPASGQAQRLLPEGARAEGSITIRCINEIKQIGATFLADDIIWQGSRYTVQNVNDFSNYGQGYYEATCTLKDLVSEP